MKWQPYSAYKPSGVEWLGDVPEHWEVRRLKDCGWLIGGAGFPQEEQGIDDEELPFYKVGDLRASSDGCVMKTSPHTISRQTAKKLRASIINPGAVIYAKIGAALLLNRRRITSSPCCIDNNMTAYVADKRFIIPKWAYYCLSILDFGEFVNPGAVPSFSEGDQGILPIQIPSLLEQTAIADFLDRETGRIDSLIEKKQTLIERLKEKRTALISRTVTRGLPPDEARKAGLDPYPKLKPSGVEWLGDVPEHWEVKSIKRLTIVQRGASPRPIDNEIYFDDNGEYSWVRISDVTTAGMYLTMTTQRLSELGSSLSVPLEPGTLFLSIAGSVGKPCITKIKCCIHDGFVYFPHWRGETRFLYYVFASGEPYKGLGKLGTQLNLNTDTVGSIIIGIPDEKEQTAIADFLDRETAKIDKLIAKIETAIERLREYRTALITAAVTGKIDVREA